MPQPILPLELILKVLLCLETEDLLRCRLTSFAFDSLIRETKELQYDVELWTNGYEDASSRDGDASTRLQTISHIQQRWNNIHDSCFSLTIPTNFTHLWQFQNCTVHEGILLVTPSNSVRSIICRRTTPTDRFLLRFDLDEVVRTKQLTPRTLDVDRPFIRAHAFPHEELLVLERVISHIPDGALVNFIHPDFYSLELEFRSLNDGRPHPRAKQPRLRIPSRQHISLELNVSGEFLIVYDLTYFAESTMRTGWGTHLYHWPTGQLIKTWACVRDETFVFGGTLLSKDAILVPTINLVTPSPTMSLDLYSIQCDPDSQWRCTLTGRFMLPTLYSIDMITSRIHQAHIWIHDKGGMSSTSSKCQPSPRLFEIHFPDYIMIIRHSAFFGHYPEGSSETLLDGGVGTVPWDVWGPHNSRILEIYSPSTQSVISGYRVSFHNEIFDFCPRRLSDPVGTDVGGVDIQEPSLLTPCIFSGEVTTSLPYRRTSLPSHLQSTRQSRCYLVETTDGPKCIRVHRVENHPYESVQIVGISVT
ncbi:hypothetical protein QCA50_011394 [Cerrena zonata]|uniref:F-box domain-containing protein n=1 Tax=Cerrena zonata TaxID=2478898 RepID=A0AAW0G725_9APHY